MLGEAIGESLGFKPEVFRQRDLWTSRIHPDDFAAVLRAASDARRQGTLSVKYRWRCADGGDKLFFDRGIMTCAPGSNHADLIGICLDITEQQKLEKLHKYYCDLGIVVPPANAALRDVLHDFNNLLTVVIWNLERSVTLLDGARSSSARWTALHRAITTVLYPKPTAPAQNGDKGSAKSAAGCTVLLVEDDPDVRAITVTRLEEMGHRVLETDGAQSALDVLANGAVVDLMLTDINLSGHMNGVDLARFALRIRPGIKLLFASGIRPAREVERKLVGEVLLKPYRNDDLTAAIARVLSRPASSEPELATQSRS
jgi:CheY-like chemotaxis protein